jgi:CBS domain-containing protein
VFSCPPDESIETAERVMSEKQIRRLPIVDGEGRPVGLLSLDDLARDAASSPRRNGVERRVFLHDTGNQLHVFAVTAGRRRRAVRGTRG